MTMVKIGKEIDRGTLPKRVLLLLTSRSYRAHAFIAAADRLGIEVVKAIDMDPQLAEYWEQPLGLQFNDQDTSVETILNYAINNPIGAILSVDDSGSEIAAKASIALGLPHNSPSAATAARDKFVMRQLLAKSDVPSPNFSLNHFSGPPNVDQLNSLAMTIAYPCVLKPLTLNGSKGVIRADNPEEFVQSSYRLWNILNSLDPSLSEIPYIVESYIHGIEVAMEGIIEDGILRVLALFDKPEPLDGPFFEETIYVTPSRLPESSQSAIFECVSQAAMALGLREGPIHAEIRLNESGPWIIEVAGRSIGGLCSKTLRFGVDASLEELILRQCFGLEIEDLNREQNASGVMMIPIPEAGLLKKVFGCQEAETVPLIESVEITAKLNNTLIPLPEGDSYLGFIFARGGSPADVEFALREAHGKLAFNIAPQLPLIASY